MPLDTTEIYVSDLEDVRQVLAACFNFFIARDLQEAQVEFRTSRPSPLTSEVERVKSRFDGYFADFLLAEHESRLEEGELGDDEELQESEDGSEGLTEVPEEELSASPLGNFKAPKQSGRRVTAEEA